MRKSSTSHPHFPLFACGEMALSVAEFFRGSYAKREWSKGTIYVPVLPIIVNGFPVGQALIDTGADVTLLPMELYQILEVDLDKEHAIEFTTAGGDDCQGVPAKERLEFCIEHSGFRPLIWKGTAFFVKGQPTVLLGQYECLSEWTLTLDGKRRKVRIE